jgi:hypothetical protein
MAAAAACNSLISTASSCFVESAAFYATVTNEAQALATAAACLCYTGAHYNPAAFDQGASACASIGGTTTVGGDTYDLAGLTDYYGFCSTYGPSLPTSLAPGPATVRVQLPLRFLKKPANY